MPADLFAAVEEERHAAGRSRSEQLAEVYRRHLEQLEEQRRVERYAAAYAQLPETAEERWLTEASTDLILGGEALEASDDELGR